MIVAILGEVGIWELLIILSLVFCYFHRREIRNFFADKTFTPGVTGTAPHPVGITSKRTPSLGTYHNCAKVIKKGISSRQ